MMNGHRRTLGTIAILAGMLLLLVVVSACSNGDSDAVDLLEYPKVGLAHLNGELHSIKQTLAELSQQLQALQK